jgi:O-antigen/teichoic acid export membrane protein
VVDLADRLLIAGLLGSVAVGPYAVGYDLVQQSLGAPLNVLLLAAFPSIVAAYENESPAAARERQHRLGAAVLTVGVPAALGLSALAGDIARLMFGYNFRADATAMMPWLACGVFFGAIKSYYFDLSFQLTHQTRMQSFIALGMAALNIALNLVLLPRIGVLGAAIATCAAFAAGLLASATIGRRVLPLPSLLGVLPGVGAATLGMYAVLRALSPHHGILWLGVKVVAGGLAYLLLAVLFNVGQSRSTLMRAWSELNLNPVDR